MRTRGFRKHKKLCQLWELLKCTLGSNFSMAEFPKQECKYVDIRISVIEITEHMVFKNLNQLVFFVWKWSENLSVFIFWLGRCYFGHFYSKNNVMHSWIIIFIIVITIMPIFPTLSACADKFSSIPDISLSEWYMTTHFQWLISIPCFWDLWICIEVFLI